MDTIFALATAQGRAGVAVVRISGPNAFHCASLLCRSLPEPRKASLRTLYDVQNDALDQALTVIFPGPGSFTGEDVVEFHVHGSTAVIGSVLRTLGSGPGRMAEPGEFTRRALENNRMDLAQVEGLGDLIEAETEAQRQQALRMMRGDLSKKIEFWRTSLIRAASLIEVTIDFVDEDVPEDVTQDVIGLLDAVRNDLQYELSGFRAAERIRTGFDVAIVGAPNVGKSTLLNALAKREAAITSDRPGTTRDLIEVRMDLNGLPVTLVDTAGLRAGEDEVEVEGIARALARAQDADLRIFLMEPDEILPIVPGPEDLVLAPKADMRTDLIPSISGKTNEGVTKLMEDIARILSLKTQGAGLATHARHHEGMQRSVVALQDAIRSIGAGEDHYDICAEEIRGAIRSLESLLGRVDVENLLDEIFASFCLGK